MTKKTRVLEHFEKINVELLGKLESMGDYVSEDGCMTCSKKYPLKFTDQLSYDEFKLSGMCQECQDKVFTEDLGLKYYRGEAV
jgi:DNA-directed RNA polymerase subunit RPC12/RpoP